MYILQKILENGIIFNKILPFTEEFMKRTINHIWFLTLLLAVLLSGCQKKSSDFSEEQTPDSNTVNLTVWGAQEDEELLRQDRKSVV